MGDKKYSKVLLILLSASIANPVFSSTHPTILTLGTGPAWVNNQANQYRLLAPETNNLYTANNYSQALLQSEIFVGKQTILTDRLLGQLGATLGAVSSAKLSGNILVNGNPEEDNFTYSYRLIHKRAAIQGKLLLRIDAPTLPWISGSIGAAYNQAFHFGNVQTVADADPTSNFTNRGTTTFTYGIGIGLQYPFHKNWQVGFAYQFTDWGKSVLGPAPDQASGTGLSITHFYTNGLLFNLTYVG